MPELAAACGRECSPEPLPHGAQALQAALLPGRETQVWAGSSPWEGGVRLPGPGSLCAQGWAACLPVPHLQAWAGCVWPPLPQPRPLVLMPPATRPVALAPCGDLQLRSSRSPPGGQAWVTVLLPRPLGCPWPARAGAFLGALVTTVL